MYLYQLVNDVGVDTASSNGVRFAANQEVKARDIGSLVLRLPVDPASIMSWGYFKNAGFALDALDRGVAGNIREAALPPQIHVGVSANPSVLRKIHDLGGGRHQQMTQPVEFKTLSGFSLDRAGKNLKSSLFAEELSGRKEKLVSWEGEALAAAKSGGTVPDAVELIKGSDARQGTVLQAQFAALKPGQHGVVIGFTTNAAPGMDVARLLDTKSAKKGIDAIRTVALDEIDFGAAGMLPLPKEQIETADIAPISTPPVASQQAGSLFLGGLTLPADLPSALLVDKGSYKAFGSTVYFAVYRKISTSAVGDTWGVGRGDFDSQFVPGESYRATVSPSLDTTAEYLYLYQVVNDRGFHDLKLPANRPEVVRTVALNDDERPAIVREVASFSLFLRSDPRLITSWGFFEDAGFNISIPGAASDTKVVSNDGGKGGIRMAASANLSILDTLFPKAEKVYRPWAPAQAIDTAKTGFDVGKDTLNIDKKTKIVFAANEQTVSLQAVAVKKLAKVKATGANRPDYVQLVYFDAPLSGGDGLALGGVVNRPVSLNLDGITLGQSEVARAVFKAEWLSRPIESGEQSIVFGFTTNAPPVRAPIRLKDRNATVNTNSEVQERVFLSPERIKAIALASAQGNVDGAGQGPRPGQGIATVSLNGNADSVAFAVASGQANGVVPAGIVAAAAGSAGSGIGLANAIPTPAEGGTGAGGGAAGVLGFPSIAGATGSPGGGLGFGGTPGVAGALGSARPSTGGGGSGGGQGRYRLRCKWRCGSGGQCQFQLVDQQH